MAALRLLALPSPGLKPPSPGTVIPCHLVQPATCKPNGLRGGEGEGGRSDVPKARGFRFTFPSRRWRGSGQSKEPWAATSRAEPRRRSIFSILNPRTNPVELNCFFISELYM